MTLRVTQDGLAINEAFEGDELTGYICPAGVPTIGRGHTEKAGGIIHYEDGERTPKVRVGKKISQAESDRLYRFDTDNAEDALERMLKRPATPHQFDAMYLIYHNIGAGNFQKSTLLRKFNAGDLKGASKAFESWNKAKINGVRKVVKGLVRRRAAEQALFDGDVERAYAIAQTTRTLPMPQAVEPPRKAESIVDSDEVITGAAAATAPAVGLIGKAQETTDTLWTLQGLKDGVMGVAEGFDMTTLFYLGVGALCCFLIWKGIKQWRDREEDGDEDLMEEVEDIA